MGYEPKRVLMLVGLAALAAAFCVLGCDGDGGVGPVEDDTPENTPDIPVPSAVNDPLPDYSDTLLFEETQIIDFSPQVVGCPNATTPLAAWWEAQPALHLLNGYCGVRTDPDIQTPFLTNGDVLARPGLNFQVCSNSLVGGFWRDCSYWGAHVFFEHDCADHFVPTLQEMPRVQRLRFWKRITVPNILQYPTQYAETHSYSQGTAEQWGRSLSFSLGGTGEQWDISLSAKLTATFTHQVTISSEQTITQQFTASSIEGKTVVFTVWQLMETYRLCNSDGTDYTDPSYAFGSEFTITNGMPLLFMSTTVFDR